MPLLCGADPKGPYDGLLYDIYLLYVIGVTLFSNSSQGNIDCGLLGHQETLMVVIKYIHC